MSEIDQHQESMNRDNDIAHPVPYMVISDFCGTLLNDQLYTREEAEDVVEVQNQEAALLGFPDVTYSIIEASQVSK